MKFKLKVSKWANFYFFVQNLSEWHFSSRKSYNNYWRSILPKFTKEKEIYLRKFGKILKKYEKSQNDVNFPIFAKICEEKHFKNIIKNLNLNEKKIFIKTFKLFDSDFKKIWEESFPRLRYFQKQCDFNDNVKIQKALKLVQYFFGKTSCPQIIIYLLIASQTDWGGGGANIGKRRITLEIGDLSTRGIKHSLSIALHEITHICYQDNFKTLIKKFVEVIPKKEYENFKIVNFFNGDLKIVINEAITSSIIAKGIIDEKIFKFPIFEQIKKNILFLDWINRSPSTLLRYSAALNLYPLNLSYLKNRKQIDLKYIEKTYQFLKKFDNKYKTGKFKDLISLK